ncbi:hypothetical protein, partial [Paraglaciecola sp.]|uniref:hypothetical protein n=1 Tax=Paraglaciecola sp. TaxID=1920173 RepID=UPI003EF38722
MVTDISKKWLLIPVMMIVGICFYLFKGLPGGYFYLDYSSYVNRIELDNKIVIAPMVLDIDDVNEFIVGLKLPVDYRLCFRDELKKVSYSNVDVVNLPEFFIIFSDTGKVLRFKTKEKFELALSKLGILNNIELDYSVFHTFWDRIPKTSKWSNFPQEDCP